MSSFQDLQKVKNSQQPQNMATIGEVVEVDASKGGVKVRLYGKSEAPDIYYNSLQVVVPGDKVQLMNVSGTTIVLGKYQY